jgi:hypothetical protein
MLIKSWENIIGKEVNYLDLYSNEIIIGRNWAGNPHTDFAGTCSIKKFLDGEHHGLIVEKFGKDVLEEMLMLLKQKH